MPISYLFPRRKHNTYSNWIQRLTVSRILTEITISIWHATHVLKVIRKSCFEIPNIFGISILFFKIVLDRADWDRHCQILNLGIYIRGCLISLDFKVSRYILTNTVSGVFEDLKFKISEGLDQNWSCPDSALLAVSV